MVQAFDLGQRRSELVAEAVDLRVEDRSLLRLLESAEDPEEARAMLARSVLIVALSPDEAGPGAGAVALRSRRLDGAERLAREALAHRPASWQAAMVAGAAPYLRWSLDRDPRLLQEYRRWEAPLTLAEELAPGQEEPVRYLTTAYLELWPALSDAKRERARELTTRAFEDAATFRRLLDPWLEVSGNDLGPIPDTPWAWTGLQDALARRQEWPGFCRAWSARRQTLRSRLADDVARGERLVETGRLLRGRTALFQAAAAAPVDRDFAPLVDHALRAAPYGPGQPDLARSLGAWLEWALDQELLGAPGAGGGLSPEALARLRAVVMAGRADAEARAAAAWTYLAAGDRRGAERAERQSGARWSDAWAPYWTVKARRQIADGELQEARRSLAEVPPSWQEHPAYRAVRRALEKAERDVLPGILPDAGPEPVSGTGPPPWRWRGTRARLELPVDRPADGLEIDLADLPEGGAALALRWDGEVVACHPVGAGSEAGQGGRLVLDRPVEPGLHRLEIETLSAASGRVTPGTVRATGR